MNNIRKIFQLLISFFINPNPKFNPLTSRQDTKTANNMQKSQLSIMKKVAKGSLEIVNKRALVRKGRIYATNLEITVSFPTNILGEGVIEIEAIEKDFDSAEIRDGFLFVTRGKSISKSAIMNSESYPEIFKNGKFLGVFNDMKAVNEIAHYAGNDPMRPVLSGIHIDETNLACTDAHRLGWRKKSGTTVSNITIDAKSLNLLPSASYRVYEAQDNPLNVIFVSDTETFSFRLIENKFPNYDAVIPKNNPLEITVNTKELLSSLTSAEPSANKATKQAIFTIFENTITVSAEDIDRSTEFSISLPISMNMDIEIFKIGFNIKYMLSVISNEKKETKITFSESSRAMIVNDNNLLMPTVIEDPVETDVNGNKKRIPFRVTPKQTKTVHEAPAPIAQKSLPAHVETSEKPKNDPCVIFCTIPKPETIEKHPEPVAETIPEPVAETVAETIPDDENTAEISQTDTKPFVLVLEYSEKAIVVIGETKPFREAFKQHHGTWNPWVKIDDVKIGGWIFSKKRRAEVEEIINA